MMELLSNNKLFEIFNRLKKTVLNIFLDVILVLLFCVAILMFFNLVSLKMGNARYPLFGAYVIVSPSMVPTINVDDAVVIKRVDVSELTEGDIITFSSSDSRYLGYTITHRIVEIGNDYSGNFIFRTKGDSNDSIDGAPVLADNVYGKVIYVIPYLGKIQRLLTRPLVWILLIIVPSVLFLISDIISIRKKSKKVIMKVNS